MSPSTRREWIEIQRPQQDYTVATGLPPHGGSGLKSFAMPSIIYNGKSPSTRREWIEISQTRRFRKLHRRLPPHGGSGLK